MKFTGHAPTVRVRPRLGLFLALLESQRQEGCVDLELVRTIRELLSARAA
jgi:hypothetical protein